MFRWFSKLSVAVLVGVFIHDLFYDVEGVQDFWRGRSRNRTTTTSVYRLHLTYCNYNRTYRKVSIKVTETPLASNRKATEIAVCKYHCTSDCLSIHDNTNFPFVRRYRSVLPIMTSTITLLTAQI